MQRPALSPLFIAFLGLLSGATLVLTLYCIARTLLHQSLSPRRPNQAQMPTTNQDESVPNSSSSETHLITVYTYTDEKKEDTCAVCLSEFTEGEDIRTLSDCTHAYHVPCIDMWLKSHPNCPICRAKTESLQQHSIVSIESFDRVSPPEMPRLPLFVI